MEPNGPTTYTSVLVRTDASIEPLSLITFFSKDSIDNNLAAKRHSKALHFVSYGLLLSTEGLSASLDFLALNNPDRT